MTYEPTPSAAEVRRRWYRVPRRRWIQFGVFGALAIIVALVFLLPTLANLTAS